MCSIIHLNLVRSQASCKACSVSFLNLNLNLMAEGDIGGPMKAHSTIWRFGHFQIMVLMLASAGGNRDIFYLLVPRK